MKPIVVAIQTAFGDIRVTRDEKGGLRLFIPVGDRDYGVALTANQASMLARQLLLLVEPPRNLGEG